MALRPAKTQISLGICPVWSESSQSTWRKLGSLATHWAHSEDSDQTGRMPRLIWVFAGRTLILLCPGSVYNHQYTGLERKLMHTWLTIRPLVYIIVVSLRFGHHHLYKVYWLQYKLYWCIYAVRTDGRRLHNVTNTLCREIVTKL